MQYVCILKAKNLYKNNFKFKKFAFSYIYTKIMRGYEYRVCTTFHKTFFKYIFYSLGDIRL